MILRATGDRRRRELEDLRRMLAIATQQLDDIEARIQWRNSTAGESRGGDEPCQPFVDAETRFASLVAIGLSSLDLRHR